MRTLRVARRYAQALMSAAEDLHTIESTATDLDVLGTVVRGSRDFRLFLGSPVVSIPRKQAVIREVFGGRVSPAMMSFLDLLLLKQREALLPDIIEQFGALRDAKLGIVNVDVTTAVELMPAQRTTLHQELERYVGGTVRLHLRLDATIRGGLVIRIRDTVVDASLAHQLERLRERFARGTAPLPN